MIAFLFAMIGCCVLCLARAARGPSVADRMLAIDTLATVVLGMTVVVFAMTGLEYLMNVAIALAGIRRNPGPGQAHRGEGLR